MLRKKLTKKEEKVETKVSTKSKKVNPKKIAEERRGLLNRISDDLEQKGIPSVVPVEQEGILNINNEYLVLPKDLTDVPSVDLGNFLNAFTQQRMYTRTLIGWQELVVEDTKRMYYDKFVPVYEELSKNKMSETSKELIANNCNSVKEHFLNYKDEKYKLKSLNYHLLSIEDAIFLISREISRRGGDFNTESRNESVQRR